MCEIDPIEKDPKFKAIIDEVEKEVERQLQHHPKELGFCHLFWKTKKSILHNKYGINWKSPAELNPDISFD